MSHSDFPLIPCDSPFSLANIPVELLTLIQTFIDPLDIISLRKTCRRVALATYEREVWLDALLYVCNTHGVFQSTFPFEHMSQRSIEHATLAPFRMNAALHKGGRQVRPLVTRILTVYDDEDEEPNHNDDDDNVEGSDSDVADIWLVPGGRFLVTTNQKSTIRLWDLGYTSDSIINPYPIASLRFDGQAFEIKVIQPTSDCLGIRLIIDCFSSSREINVYEIYHSTPTPTFNLLTSMTLPTPDYYDSYLEVYGCIGNLFAFHIDRKVTVWDIVTNSMVTWNVEKEYSEILAMKDHIIMFLDTEVTLWKIPPLRPTFGLVRWANSVILMGESATYTLIHPRLATSDYTIVPPISPWPQGLHRPVCFVLSTDNDLNGISLDFYIMTPNNLQWCNGTPKYLAVQWASATTNNPDPVYIHGRFCGNSFIQPWREYDERIVVNVMDLPDARKPMPPPSTTVQLCPGKPGFSDFDFCPVSGRLCVVDGNEVRVMDYLLPP